jgi:hypothetical protein
MREPAHDGAPRDALNAAPATPSIRFNDAALDHRPIRLDVLPRRDKSKLVESAERGQVRGREGSVGHVEVFRLGGVGTSILEDLDPYPDTDALPAATPSIAMSLNARCAHESAGLVAADVVPGAASGLPELADTINGVVGFPERHQFRGEGRVADRPRRRARSLAAL